MATIYQNFRKSMGFTNAEKLRKYYKAKDIQVINYPQIEECNQRLKDIFHKLNLVVHASIRTEDIQQVDSEIDTAYHILRDNDMFTKFNNNGRAPEDVYYNWMRGYVVCKYFSKALSIVFDIPEDAIRSVGHDQLTDIDTFSKSPIADLEITLGDEIVRLEIQAGFSGMNDIKKHKVEEAKRIYNTDRMLSYVVHFDLFNGTVAIVDISNVQRENVCWEQRSQFEGQWVFAIPKEAFRWMLTDVPPNYEELLYR